MSGVGEAVWEASRGVGEAVWIASRGVGDAVWFATRGVGGAVWIAAPGVGRAVWAAGCFPESEFVHAVADMRIPIGEIKVGNKISSWDAEKKKAQFTAVTDIHEYKVWEIICFNNVIRVSSSHPLMVIESGEDGIFTQKWKVASNVNVGDCLVGTNGKHITVKSRGYHWYDSGMKVLNLSTDSGVPFLVGDCVVRAENAMDNLEWVGALLPEKLIA